MSTPGMCGNTVHSYTGHNYIPQDATTTSATTTRQVKVYTGAARNAVGDADIEPADGATACSSRVARASIVGDIARACRMFDGMFDGTFD